MAKSKEPGGVVTVKPEHLPKYRQRYLDVSVFDETTKEVFLDTIAKHGRVMDACRAAGISHATFRKHLSVDPEFSGAYEVARQEYADYVTSEIERRALHGVEKPIFGGKYKDEQVGVEVVYSDSLAVMHAKRYVPEYREKQQIDVAVTGGVLAVAASLPNSSKGTKAWKAEYGGEYLPGEIECIAPPNREALNVEQVEESSVDAAGSTESRQGEVEAGQ